MRHLAWSLLAAAAIAVFFWSGNDRPTRGDDDTGRPLPPVVTSGTGRYGLMAYQEGFLGQVALMVDSNTGKTWRLDWVDTKLPDGQSVSHQAWYPIESSETPLPDRASTPAEIRKVSPR